MKKTKKRSALVIALVVILLALALGYATFTATLTINGTATGTGSWDVRFTQTRWLKADGTTVDNTHNNTATISTTTKTNDTITASVDLAYPGDGVLLEAVVTNNSTMPAKLTGFTVTGTDTDFEVTQAAGPAENEVLAANGGTCTATFLVKWKTTSTVAALGNKTFTITYNYTQETTEFTGTPSHTDAQP
ncbi:MAG: hypothetical protein IKF17_05190 [Clostridia bacterium]|nr:hypothetical protein [Clostridia bacterium]